MKVRLYTNEEIKKLNNSNFTNEEYARILDYKEKNKLSFSEAVCFLSISALNKPDGKYKNHNKSIKRVQKMYDYYTGKLTKENTMNLIKEDGTFAASKEVEKRKKLAVKYLENSNL